MIIYKYVDAKTLEFILSDLRIGFSHPRDFNDPFDQPRVSKRIFTAQRSLFDDRLMTPELQKAQAEEAWGRCAVSSFTRTYDNALMWAHYADKHAGAVIEIDARKAGLMSTELLIPVQFGSVIYMKRPNPDASLARGIEALRNRTVNAGENRFEIGNYEGLQRLFLTKPIPWFYEEEVRAVCQRFLYAWDKNGESLTGDWKKIVVSDTKMIYGLRVPPGSITRVFAGLRYQKLDDLRERCADQKIELMVPVDELMNGYEIEFEPDRNRLGD